jgi:NhaA family Na+:H+ antiporter
VIIDYGMLEQLTSTIISSIVAGLVVGTPVGIYLFTKLLITLKWVTLPSGVTSTHIIGATFLAGIGFTMSLFITDLAFNNPECQIIAIVAVFVASLL